MVADDHGTDHVIVNTALISGDIRVGEREGEVIRVGRRRVRHDAPDAPTVLGDMITDRRGGSPRQLRQRAAGLRRCTLNVSAGNDRLAASSARASMSRVPTLRPRCDSSSGERQLGRCCSVGASHQWRVRKVPARDTASVPWSSLATRATSDDRGKSSRTAGSSAAGSRLPRGWWPGRPTER